MPLIKTVGEFEVSITEAYWAEMKAKGTDAQRMDLVLKCVTDPDGEEAPQGRHMDYHMYFTRQIVTGGKNKGKPLYEVSMRQCIELGMSEPFSPDKISELVGISCVLVTKEEEYEGEKRIKPQFLNPVRHRKMDPSEATSIWNALTGGKSVSAPTTGAKPAATQPAKSAEPEDDLPF
jgi:hypothetical protein